MFDEQDQEVGPILVLVLGIAIVVCLFTIAVALSVTGVIPGGGPVPVEDAGVARASVHFAIGSSELPADTATLLFTVVVAATIEPTRHLHISGYTDASGDAATNATLARDRAKAVAEALHAAGITRERIELHKPIETTGSGGDPDEARRVDIEMR